MPWKNFIYLFGSFFPVLCIVQWFHFFLHILQVSGFHSVECSIKTSSNMLVWIWEYTINDIAIKYFYYIDFEGGNCVAEEKKSESRVTWI